jgi:hypothetical protein
MSKQTVQINETTEIDVTAVYGYTMVGGREITNKDEIVVAYTVRRAGKDEVRLAAYQVTKYLRPETIAACEPALVAAIDELTGTTLAERSAAAEAKRARINAEDAEYRAAYAATTGAMTCNGKSL